MKINFEIHANTTYYFNVEAHLEIKGHGEIDLMGDDYDYIPENMSNEEFVDWIYDTYLIDYNLNEDNITLNEKDVELSYNKYLEVQNESI